MKIMRQLCLICFIGSVVCGCTPIPDTQKTPDPDYRNDNSSDVPEEEYQEKLDNIYPEAYGNTDGINPDPGMSVSMVGRRGKGSYWEEIERGAGQAIDDFNKKMGYEGEDKLKMTYNGPVNHLDVGDQVNILDEELARNPGTIAISLIDRTSCKIQFDLAAESGINIVTFESGSEYEGVSASIKEENERMGAEAAEKMKSAVTGEGKILIVSASSKNETFREREFSFREKMRRDFSEITVGETLYIFGNPSETNVKEGGEKPVGEDLILKTVKENPNIIGVYATDEMASQTVINAIDDEEFNHIKIIGIGAEKDMIESQSFERVDALVCENPFGIGYATVIAAVRAGMSLGNEAEIRTGYRWVTRDNKEDEYITQWAY